MSCNDEYKFDPHYIRQKVRQRQRYYEKRGKNFVDEALETIRDRLDRDPASYHSYGPYWWALKMILIDRSMARGDTVDYSLAREFRGETEAETIVMAETFAKTVYGTFFSHNKTFMLDSEDPDGYPEAYTLSDPEYDFAATFGRVFID